MSARARNILNVDDDDWNLFAGLARIRNMALGEYLGILVRQEAERVGLKPSTKVRREKEVGEQREEEHDKDGGDPENLP